MRVSRFGICRRLHHPARVRIPSNLQRSILRRDTAVDSLATFVRAACPTSAFNRTRELPEVTNTNGCTISELARPPKPVKGRGVTGGRIVLTLTSPCGLDRKRGECRQDADPLFLLGASERSNYFVLPRVNTFNSVTLFSPSWSDTCFTTPTPIAYQVVLFHFATCSPLRFQTYCL